MNQQALLWELVKCNNSHLIKRNNVCFSSDPSNPSGVQRKSMCGLIQNDSVAIKLDKKDPKKKNKSVFLLDIAKRRRFQAKDSKTKKQHHQVNLKVNSVHKAAKIAKNINKYSNQERAKLSVKKVARLHSVSARV